MWYNRPPEGIPRLWRLCHEKPVFILAVPKWSIKAKQSMILKKGRYTWNVCWRVCACGNGLAGKRHSKWYNHDLVWTFTKKSCTCYKKNILFTSLTKTELWSPEGDLEERLCVPHKDVYSFAIITQFFFLGGGSFLFKYFQVNLFYFMVNLKPTIQVLFLNAIHLRRTAVCQTDAHWRLQ